MIKRQIQFCSICGARLIFDRTLAISVCPRCRFRSYQNSKITVSTIIKDGEKILLAQRESGKLKGYWGAPGGFLDNGEDILAGLKREVKEEIGVEIEIESFISSIVEDDMNNPLENSFVVNLQFLAKITKGTPKALHETADVKWFTKEEIPWEKIAFPGITQALRIVFKIDKPYFPK